MSESASLAHGLTRWLLAHPLIAPILLIAVVVGGLVVLPFELDLGPFPRSPVAVDAIPDTGENQQIVFADWPGQAPRDVEDQLTWPLANALLGVTGVQSVRSVSMFGFATVNVIFEDGVDVYFARSRLLEALASLPPAALPEGVRPTLGPDATAVGQVFWYTLEAQDAQGRVVGGFDPHELRSLQDWTIRPALQGVSGVAEVAGVGGFVRELHVDVDPNTLRLNGVGLGDVIGAARDANLDVGARTVEVGGVEHLVRGVGRVTRPEQLDRAVVGSRDGVALTLDEVASIGEGPALRRGLLDDAGAPAVGGVVVARQGANAQAVVAAIKARIDELAPSLPARTLEDGTEARVRIVPFYDRAALIDETLGTLSTALWQQVLIATLVVLVMLRDVRAALLVAGLLPVGVLLSVVAMRAFGVEANLMALGGIAIAIGTMVDIGIVFVENAAQRLADAEPEASRREVVGEAIAEVAPAVSTSVLTTVVGFLPVFGLTAAELKLFAPLAYTKTFAMVAALALAVALLPVGAWLLLRRRGSPPWLRWGLAIVVLAALATSWMPLGLGAGVIVNALAVALLVAVVLGTLRAFERVYPQLLGAALRRPRAFLALPLVVCLGGVAAWSTLDREYMPPFDEGAFLFMPTTMPHVSVGEAQLLLGEMDAAIAMIPEVDRVVGKAGRVDSALDPAPLSMFETVVTLKPEFTTDPEGRRVRQWRDHIRHSRDVWPEITRAAHLPGVTGAPMLMPIEARRVMLQSGMRSRTGLKLFGADQATLDAFGQEVEAVLRDVPELRRGATFAERVVGRAYLQIEVDRDAARRHGLRVAEVQQALSVLVGGQAVGTSLQGRERYTIRVRAKHELRDDPEAIGRLPVVTASGAAVPLSELASITRTRGPEMIRAEDTFLVSYVLFDPAPGVGEVDAVVAAQRRLDAAVASGELRLPAGVRMAMAGTYEAHLRSTQRLSALVPLALGLVFLLLYATFHRASVALSIFAGVAVAASGGFGLLWLQGLPGFLDVSVLGVHLGELFQVGQVNLSVAVWVGFIALAGIAVDDGVVVATFLRQRFDASPPQTAEAVREATLDGGLRRVRACLMTTATTLLALLPVVTATGRGADVMRPMALPMVGGMAVALLTLFVVPVLWSMAEGRRVG